jgi:hypothetical protein
MSLTTPSVSLRVLSTLNQTLSVKRTACSILMGAWWEHSALEMVHFMRRLVKLGADPKQKLLLVLVPLSFDREVSWEFRSLQTGQGCHFPFEVDGRSLEAYRNASLVFEVDLDYAIILAELSLTKDGWGSLNRSKLRVYKIQTTTQSPHVKLGRASTSSQDKDSQTTIWSPSEEHERRIIDCMNGASCRRLTNYKRSFPIQKRIDGLDHLLHEAPKYGSTEMSTSDFMEKLVASGHFVRRHSEWGRPPLPPDPFTGEPLEMDMATVIQDERTPSLVGEWQDAKRSRADHMQVPVA